MKYKQSENVICGECDFIFPKPYSIFLGRNKWFCRECVSKIMEMNALNFPLPIEIKFGALYNRDLIPIDKSIK